MSETPPGYPPPPPSDPQPAEPPEPPAAPPSWAPASPPPPPTYQAPAPSPPQAPPAWQPANQPPPPPAYQPPPGHPGYQPPPPVYPPVGMQGQPPPVMPMMAVGGGISLMSQFRGSAMWSCILGLVSVIAPLTFGTVFFFLPLIGLYYGVRAIRRGQLIGGIVGIVLCSIGGILTLISLLVR